MLAGLERSLSIAGLTGPHALAPGGVREQIVAAAGLGYRAVQIDATAEGVRPRELDRSGRRDLASLLRRLGVGLSGLDLWVPAEHFVDAARVDRAVGAVTAALKLAAELAGCLGSGRDGALVCLSLPQKAAPDFLSHLGSSAELAGARIADHAWPVRAGEVGAIGVGIDPAAMIFSGADPAVEVARLKTAPLSARLNDLSSVGRVEPGTREGRLDVMAYTVGLVTAGYRGFLVVDVRGLSETGRVAGGLVG